MWSVCMSRGCYSPVPLCVLPAVGTGREIENGMKPTFGGRPKGENKSLSAHWFSNMWVHKIGVGCLDLGHIL